MKTRWISYDDLLANPPHELLGITLTEYQLSLDAFRRDRLEGLQPISDAIDWFKQHGHKACHAALTAVPLWAAPLSRRLGHASFWALDEFVQCGPFPARGRRNS